MCFPYRSSPYVLLPKSTSSGPTLTRYFCNSALFNQTSQASVRSEEATLNEVILAMKTVPELLETYKNFQDTALMVQRNRVTVIHCITNIIQKNKEQRVSLNTDINKGPDGNNGLFIDLLNQTLEHISESSGRDLASMMWSLGKIRESSSIKKHALIKACEREILSRDVTAFDFGAINQILTGLSALNMKKSEFWTKMQSSLVSGEIQISDCDNQALVGSVWAFMKTGNGSPEFFHLCQEEIYLRGLSEFKGSELSQLVFSFAKKGIQADKLYSHIEEEILRLGLNNFCDMKIFLVLWAFANCKSNRTFKPLFSQIDGELVAHGVTGFTNSDLSNIVWCFSKVGVFSAKVYDVVKEEILHRGIDTFRTYLLQLAWSFAMARKKYSDFNEKVTLEFLSLDPRKVDKKVLCDYAWCFGRLGITNDKAYQMIEMEILRRNPYLNHIQVNKFLTGFAHAKKGSKEFFEFLEVAMLKLNVSTLKAADVCNLLWPFAEMGYKVPQLYDVVEKEILHRGKSHFTLYELRKMTKSYEAFGQGSKELMELLYN